MVGNKSKNTKPELVVRRTLTKWGFRYRIHYRELIGTPDIAFPKEKVAIFVHGCFWHQHGDCLFLKPTSIPKSWRENFIRANLRDVDNLRKVRELGWIPFVLWECRILESVTEELEPVVATIEMARRRSKSR
jgi:DNA mismatch endonuclease (patch repair protein)